MSHKRSALSQSSIPWPWWAGPAILGFIALISSASAIVVFTQISTFNALESRLSDQLRLEVAPTKMAQDARISFVAIDEETMKSLPYRSPVDRAFLAELIDSIGLGGARAIGLDILFDQPTEPEKDARLVQALKEFPGQVVIAWGDARSGMTAEQTAWLADFQEQAQATYGFANLTSTSDGVVRHHNNTLAGVNHRSFSGVLAGADKPEGAHDRWLIDWRMPGPGGAAAFQWLPAHVLPNLKASPAVLGTMFKDRIVIIGADLPLVDRHETPLSALGITAGPMPGAMIHAHIISQLLDNRLPPAWSQVETFLIILCLALLTSFVARGSFNVFLKGLAVLALATAYLVSIVLTVKSGWPPSPIAPTLLAMLLSFIGAASLDTVISRRERQFIQGAFSQYLAPELVTRLIRDPTALKVGGERRQLSFMFTDIAGFTTLSEQMEPASMTAMLNQYLDGVCEIVIRHRGVIDKFIGDAVVALFGVPEDDPAHAAQAIACARDIDVFSEGFRALPGRSDLGVTRIGVHTGEATVGNFGGTARFDYTAIGDAMNTAARLESANKTFGTRIAISDICLEQAKGHLNEDLPVQPIGRVILMGKTEPLLIATLKQNAQTSWIDKYMMAYDRLGSDPDQAAHLLADLCPDPVVQFHLDRLAAGEIGQDIRMKGK